MRDDADWLRLLDTLSIPSLAVYLSSPGHAQHPVADNRLLNPALHTLMGLPDYTVNKFAGPSAAPSHL